MQEKINSLLVFSKNQRLETERLVLRPITLRDVSAMYDYASDEETSAYVFPIHKSMAETEIVIANYFMSHPLGKYGIEWKQTQQLIGAIELRVEEEKKVGELGYSLNKKFWGKGIIPEAATELLKLGFEEMALIRVFAVHDIENPNSGRVMEKLGMKIEGTIPNARIWRKKAVTDVLRGITAEEWREKE